MERDLTTEKTKLQTSSFKLQASEKLQEVGLEK
jgi:hypothetical protein